MSTETLPTYMAEKVADPKVAETSETSSLDIKPKRKNPFKGKSSRFWIAFGFLNLSALISAIDAVIVASALPAISADLGGNSNQAFWTGTAFLLAATITQPLYGSFSEIFGRRINLIVALGWFLVGSILCARASDMVMLIASRVVIQPLRSR
jgi:MFS family permease